MITHVTRQMTLTITLIGVIALSIEVFAAATPQSALEELLAADRAFSAASAGTDLVTGLTAMFASGKIMLASASTDDTIGVWTLDAARQRPQSEHRPGWWQILR